MMMARTRDKILKARLDFAREALSESGRLTGRRTRRIGARVDPGLIEAAIERTGIASETALLEAALTLLAEPDDFGVWLVSRRGTLDKDFELAL
jgi:hypothetical protein